MRQVSISMLQRKMRIGYNRSARMIERMEREGIVGAADGANPARCCSAGWERCRASPDPISDPFSAERFRSPGAARGPAPPRVLASTGVTARAPTCEIASAHACPGRRRPRWTIRDRADRGQRRDRHRFPRHRYSDRRAGGGQDGPGRRRGRAVRSRIELLSALRHPGIVAYLGHGRTDDELYLVMEWLEGEDLATRLAGAEVSLPEAVEIARQVAAALAVAHQQGIVHRDIKPSNVFLADWRLDRVKLLDYGIARRAGMESLTGFGSVVGTPAYMAPEQARGRRNIDARADVYALGALLFRCLAGRPPFEGGTPDELIAAVVHRPVPRLRELVDVPPELDALVAQMLDKDPRRRPADGAAAWAALCAIDLGAAGVGARPLGSLPGSESPTGPGSATPVTGERTPGQGKFSSIAVLSFLDMSSSGDQGYLCDGIADELINTLTKVQGLRVAARSTSFQFKSQAADARAIGSRLGVDAILEGGVRKSGDRLRVTVQLVDVTDGSPRWSHRFDGKVDDVFDIQDQIASSVAVALRGMLSTHELDALRRPGTTVEAYEHFLRGRQLFYTVSVASWTRRSGSSAEPSRSTWLRTRLCRAGADPRLEGRVAGGRRGGPEGRRGRQPPRARAGTGAVGVARRPGGGPGHGAGLPRGGAGVRRGDPAESWLLRCPLPVCPLLLPVGTVGRIGGAVSSCGRAPAGGLSISYPDGRSAPPAGASGGSIRCPS
jgi:TolB-like protein